MEFDWQGALSNFCEFADEVVVAVNTSEDDTLVSIRAFAESLERLRIIQTDFGYDDPDLDGKIKNAALQATNEPYKIGLDLDERVRLEDKEKWRNFISYFMYDQVDAIMLPVINLYKEKERYKDIAQKWYLHRTGLFRGTFKQAKRKDGTHDISTSDSCELIDKDGNLVRSLMLVDPNQPNEVKLQLIKNNGLPFVIHYGYIDLEKKAYRTRTFWKKHWATECGEDDVDIPTTKEEIEEKERLVEGHLHGLEINE